MLEHYSIDVIWNCKMGRKVAVAPGDVIWCARDINYEDDTAIGIIVATSDTVAWVLWSRQPGYAPFYKVKC